MATPINNRYTAVLLQRYIDEHNCNVPKKTDKLGRKRIDQSKYIGPNHARCMEKIIIAYSASVQKFENTGQIIKEHQFITNNPQIATMCSCSTRTAARWVARLVQAKLLTKRNRGYIVLKDGKYQYQNYQLTINKNIIHVLKSSQVMAMFSIYSTKVENQSVSVPVIQCSLNPRKGINNKIMLSETAIAVDDDLKISEKVEGDGMAQNLPYEDVEGDEKMIGGKDTQAGRRSADHIAAIVRYTQILYLYAVNKLFSNYEFLSPKERKLTYEYFYDILQETTSTGNCNKNFKYYILAIDKAKEATKRTAVSKHKKNFEIPLPSLYFNENNKWGFVKIHDLLARDNVVPPEIEKNFDYQVHLQDKKIKEQNSLLHRYIRTYLKDETPMHYNRLSTHLFKKHPEIAGDFTNLVQLKKQSIKN